jgi:MFS transporter, DHA3 family, macrolide efflux protein
MIILCCDAVLALCVALAGYFTSLYAYCILESAAGMSGSIAASCGYAIWMSRIPDKQRGSVMVLLSSVTMLSTAIFVIFGGIIVERLFEPALTVDGALAATVGEWLGVGAGRGIAFMFVISGSLGMVIALGGLAVKPLRELD